MDGTTIVRIVAGVLFVIVLVILMMEQFQTLIAHCWKEDLT